MSDEKTPPDSQPPFEFQKWLHEIKRQDAQRAHDRHREFFDKVNEATIKSADAALRASLLINGGAAISVLAFIGGLVSQNRVKLSQLGDISNSLMLFAFGVSCAVGGMALSYFTHYATIAHSNTFEKKWGHPYLVPGKHTRRNAFIKAILHFTAIAVGLASIALFILGMLGVKNSIIRLGVQSYQYLQAP